VVSEGYFYRRGFKTGKEDLVSVINNDPPPSAVTHGPLEAQLRRLSEGMYETARYMLLKNKKK
jgi:hypothetical protein